MSTTNEKGLRHSRVRYTPGVDLDDFRCPLCLNVLWKPVACLTCENPFCSKCISKRLETDGDQCPMNCGIYTERSCPPFILRQLLKMKIDCIYQPNGCNEVFFYEGLEKHEAQCGYYPQQCSGCRQLILKKNFPEHEARCPLIELTCADCKLVFKRRDAPVCHTESLCLKEQLKQIRNESQENKRQLNAMQDFLFPEKITFDDITDVFTEPAPLPKIYKSLKWTNFNYVSERFVEEEYPDSGYITAFTPGGSSYVVFSDSPASIGVKNKEKVFGVVSLRACTAWVDTLKLTITGYRKSNEIYKQTSTLARGKPHLIQLYWTDIDKLKFQPEKKSNLSSLVLRLIILTTMNNIIINRS